MESFTCPFCSKVVAVNDTSRYSYNTSRNHAYIDKTLIDEIIITYYHCPSCDNYTVKATGLGDKVKSISTMLQPRSLAKHFPDYIPESIRNDYEEACAIVELSPKASATLSRRCLQGMIRDFWNVSGKPNLKQEIDAIKERVQPTQWKAIDAIRSLGNIGAHMEKDVNLIVDIDPNEAKQLIRLIEHLMEDWYIRRHEQEELFNSIQETNTEKQNQRHSKE